MASAFDPDLPKASLPTRAKKAIASQSNRGLGISDGIDYHTGFISSSVDQSPDRSTQQWPNDDKENPSSITVDKAAIRQISQGLSELNAHLHRLATPKTSPVLKQVGSTSSSLESSVKDTVEDVQDETITIAQLQKDAAAAHSATITALLHKHVPAPLLEPYPSTSSDKSSLSGPMPSILDLEVRHAIASAPIQVYLNHIPSKVARQEFLRLLTKSEEQNFGHGSRVANAMHQDSMQAEKDEEKRGVMQAKWNDKGCRREMRKKNLVEALSEEIAASTLRMNEMSCAWEASCQNQSGVGCGGRDRVQVQDQDETETGSVSHARSW